MKVRAMNKIYVKTQEETHQHWVLAGTEWSCNIQCQVFSKRIVKTCGMKVKLSEKPGFLFSTIYVISRVSYFSSCSTVFQQHFKSRCHCFKENSLYDLVAFVLYLPLIKSFSYGFINSPALVSLKGTHKDLAKISLLPNKDITISEDLGWVGVFSSWPNLFP